MSISSFRSKIRPYLLTIAFSAMGFAVVWLLETLFGIELSKLEKSVIAFIVTSLCVLLLFPRVFKIPFGKVSVIEFLNRVGLYFPREVYKFVILGVICAIFPLAGMLVGSMLTGKFIFDTSNITLSQAVFSLTPGIWEEVLFRGVLMILLMRHFKSIKKAAAIQLLLFGLAHIKGFDLLSFIDTFFVIIVAISFTYTAYKTKSLIPGIIFHYLYDTFIFFVQLPDEAYEGFKDNALFYASLTLAVALSILITKILSDKFNIKGTHDIYDPDTQFSDKVVERKERGRSLLERYKNKRIFILNVVGFSAILILGYSESNFFVNICLALFVICNIIFFFRLKEASKNARTIIHILTAFIAFVTAYDYYIKGSKQVYLIWILLGFLNILILFIKRKSQKLISN